MILPKEKTKAEIQSPETLILYGPPKIGKTTLLATLDNFLILDFEKGSKKIDALKLEVNDLKELKEAGTEIIKAGSPYTGVISDTVTQLEDWCEWDATEEYMGSIMGKAFNSKMGSILPKSEWKSVLTLPNGAGYLWHRNSFKSWIGKINKLAKYKIHVAHVKDIFLEKDNETVSSKDLDLVGKDKAILCANADAIGYLYRTSKNPLELRISFKNHNQDLVGSRCQHLRNQDFVLAVNNEDGSIAESYWNKIYID